MYSDERRDNRNEHDADSSSGSHITKTTDEKSALETKNVLESAFFSLSSAVRSGKHKVLEEQNTDLDNFLFLPVKFVSLFFVVHVPQLS